MSSSSIRKLAREVADRASSTFKPPQCDLSDVSSRSFHTKKIARLGAQIALDRGRIARYEGRMALSDSISATSWCSRVRFSSSTSFTASWDRLFEDYPNGDGGDTDVDPICQLICFSPSDFQREVLMEPLQYLKENSALRSVSDNELLKDYIGQGSPYLVSVRGQILFRSLLLLTLENHRRGFALSDSLDLANLRISKDKGKFILKKVKKWRLTEERRLQDHQALYNLYITLLEQTEGDDCYGRLPLDLKDFLDKLTDQAVSVKRLVYHSLFLSYFGRLCFRIFVDLFIRKKVNYVCDFNMKKKAASVLKSLPYLTNNEWKIKAAAHPVINSFYVHNIQARAAQEKQFKKKAVLTKEPLQLQEAGQLVSLQRDGVCHLFEVNLSGQDKKMKKHLDLSSAAELLHFTFQKFEYEVQDLFDHEDWFDKLCMDEMFSENCDTTNSVIQNIISSINERF